ncbi:MAG: NlpC/P60 family protein [Hyphomicrobium sp.]|nr:peptidase P60 [Hyphomicrobium sp.]
MQKSVTRDQIVAAARSWTGTPYHHQASCKAIGADCLGLVRGVWRDVYGFDVEGSANYSRDWAEASGIETMLAGARQHLITIALGGIKPGDVIVFRLRPGCVAKHAAIVATGQTMIHAMEGGPASEVALSSWWRRRIAGAFQFPNLQSGD